MRTYTIHTRPGAPPSIVPEAFSWGGLFFGPLWLLRHRAWLPGLLAAAALAAVLTGPPRLRPVLSFGVLLCCAVLGQDARRWSLGLRGFALEHVIAADSADGAFLRLMGVRPDLGRMLP